MGDNNNQSDELQIAVHKTPQEIHVQEEEMQEMQDWQVETAYIQEDIQAQHDLQEMDDSYARELLLKDKKRFGDSKLMKAVKTEVGKIDELRIRRIKADEVQEAMTTYYNAIISCDKYLADRKSSSETGSRRREMVEDNRDRLIREYELVVQLKDLMEAGRFDGFLEMNLTLDDLICRVKLYRVAAKPKEIMGEKQEGDSTTADPALSKVLRAFKVDDTSIKKEKDREQYGQDIGELYRELKAFPVGKFHTAFVTIGGENVIIKQDEHGTVTITNQKASVVMKESAEKLLNMVEKKMIEEQDKMPAEYMMEVVSGLRAEPNWAEDGKKDMGQFLTARAGVARFLELKTGVPANSFANVDLTKLRWICYGYIQGTDEATLKLAMAELLNKAINEEQKLVNNMETLELLKQTSTMQDEMEEKVILHKQEEQQDQELDEREQKVRTLMADLVFSSDTWEADETVMEPGERVRRLLLKNSDIVASMIKESYEEGGEDVDLEASLRKIMRKAVLGTSPDETAVNLALSGLVVRMVENFSKDSYKDATEAQIKDDLEMTLKSKDEEVMENCRDIDSSVDEMVEGCSELLQSQITESVEAVFTSQPEETVERQIGPKDPVYYQDGRVRSPEQKRISDEVRKQRREAGEKELNKKLEEAIKGDSGQGLFIKNIFNTYFTDANLMDRRNMFAYAIRGMKPSTGDVQEDAGRFLGGIMKGAGPLFQKIMQGLPTDGMPPAIQAALADMKSKLAPIPDEIVKAQLMGIVKRSKGKVEKIEVTRALGAASVGQTFLCKMYGPDLPEDGKDVVVKLLKPDVRNRMMREKDVMLKCAAATDEGMKSTYMGQLERIEEELDLTIEARNVVKGEIYDGKDGIQSMKLVDIVDPTINSMVLEKAPGETVDRYMKGLKERNEARRADIAALNDDSTAADIMKVRQALIKDLGSLAKRQQFMAKLSDKWVTEGIFGKGFYHGDLHAGNIMINDEGLTVIDFGNATTLSEEQKLYVTRMVGAAAVGDTTGFRDALHSLLKPEFEEKYSECKSKLTKEIRSIFELGDKNSAGQRIAVALMKAQELGIEVPSAIYNFSQCQLRLQNAVDEMYNEIERMKQQLVELEERTKVKSNDPNINPDVIHEAFCGISKVMPTDDLSADARLKREYERIAVLYKAYSYDDLEYNRASLKSGSFYKKNFEGRDDRVAMQQGIDKLMEYFEKNKSAKVEEATKLAGPVTSLIDMNLFISNIDCRGPEKTKQRDELRRYLEGRKDLWFNAIDSYNVMKAAVDSTEDGGEQDRAMQAFLNDFRAFGVVKMFNDYNSTPHGGMQLSIEQFRIYLTPQFYGLMSDKYEKLYEEDENVGPLLKQKVDDILEYMKGDGALDGMLQRQDEIMLMVADMAAKEVRPFFHDMKKTYEESVSKEVKNFVDVMGETICDHKGEAVKRLGFFSGLYYGMKLGG